MSRDDHPIRFRADDALREKLRAASKANKRSISAEIAARLEMTFASESGQGLGETHLPDDPVAKVLTGKGNTENLARDVRWLKKKVAELETSLKAIASGKLEK